MQNPFNKLNTSRNSRPTTVNRSESYKQIIDPKKALNTGLFFGSDITTAPTKGNLSFKEGLFGTTTPSPIQGGQPAFKPTMAGSPMDISKATSFNPPAPGSSTKKTQAPPSSSQYGPGGMPVTSPPFTMKGGTADKPVVSESSLGGGEAVSGGEVGGGTGGEAGSVNVAGGYTPEGFSKIDEQLQELSDTNPELADKIMDSLGYSRSSTGALVAGGAGGGTKGGALASKFEQGFNAANASLGGAGGQGGLSGAQGASLVNQYSPAKSNTMASMFVQTDPYIEGLVKAWQDYINPQNQRKSLADTYNQMLKDSGVEAIDLELINAKNVIEGSEDDIRTEITKAGGFATNSQVLGLTNARNKQLIKNYNTLLDTRNAKEKYLETAIGLEQADRESADRRFESAFSMGTQLATLQNQMQTNARNQMQWLATNIGFDGLYEATGGDRFAINLIEQTLGITQGGLYGVAQQARQDKFQKQQEAQLDLQIKQEELAAKPLEREYKAEQIKTEALRREDIRSQIKSRNIQDMIDMQKLSKGVSDEERQLGSLDLVNTLDSIQIHKGFNNAVGPGFFKWFTRAATPGGAKQAFIGDVQNIVDNMSLEKLIKAKAEGATFGALSDNELRMLGSAATKIGTWTKKNKNGEVVGYNVSEKAFRGELDRISSLTKRAYILSGYSPQDVGAQVMDDGSVWVQNYDGSLTEIYR